MTTGCQTPAAPLIERVHRDHALLRTLFDALALTRDVRELRAALWDLYLTFNGHLDMEEMRIAPLLRAGPAPERANAMILEHNEQRRVMLELVEDTECDAKEVDALVSEAVALVLAFRTDMILEERSLASLLADDPRAGAYSAGVLERVAMLHAGPR